MTASHKRDDRKTRDAFLEKACAAGVHLVRFTAHERFALSDVRTRLMAL